QVMLRIIDQRWREHLEEMDYLKEGINLRAVGQKDPLTEWQREGFEMFGAMMKGIAQDFVKYVMHVQVVRNEDEQAPDDAGPAPAPSVSNLRESSSDDDSSSGFSRAARSAAADGEITEDQAMDAEAADAPARPKTETVVKDDWSRTPRNAPCPCGSGKKFKLCHGAA
ncbi:MAG: SEC-C metal-binding domain-containing protein, partial [Actinomycetota bacterium]|nr:SEC-C metal-binding domain-containing protein [Actinomycetota bacterium]